MGRSALDQVTRGDSEFLPPVPAPSLDWDHCVKFFMGKTMNHLKTSHWIGDAATHVTHHGLIAGIKGNETGWFPGNYMDETQIKELEPMYTRPAVQMEDPQTEALDVVITLYPFNSVNSEELNFEKDERWVDPPN